MNERLKSVTSNFKGKWAAWKPLQKAIAVGIAAVLLIAVIFLVRGSSRPADVRLFNRTITNDSQIEAVANRLDSENVHYRIQDGIFYMDTEAVARKWRPKLVAEGLVPSTMSAYDVFNEKDWTRTDFDNKVHWQEAMEVRLRDNLRRLDGIEDAAVNITYPEDALLSEDQKPVTASITLWASYSLDKHAIQGIHELCKKSVEGLLDSGLTIIDGKTSNIINDFEGMEAIDALNIQEREQRIRQKWEAQYSSAVVVQLGKIYPDRVHIANMTVEIDFSKEQSEATIYSGITIQPDDPNTPYPDGKVVESLVESEESVDKEYTGTQFTPEGPPGMEGQNPIYADNLNTIGKSTEKGVKRNYALNSEHKISEKKPMPGRRTIAVNIDSKWVRELDIDGNFVVDEEKHRIKRDRVDLSPKELEDAVSIVKGAIGYDEMRGDEVVVRNIPGDHDKEFLEEDMAYIKRLKRNKAIILGLIGIAVVLVAFILFRIISRELERRRRLREEEALRRQREEREKALWDAKESGMEVTMSVEERKRAELQEAAVAMAKEHPEDVAMLIRTWLMEE
ncbi:MAG: flagellar M-ring protein FliF [Treponema sp.]|nr:flagellar M-ring protein FliF [Treponema sp.]